jgi:hypothetical protein
VEIVMQRRWCVLFAFGFAVAFEVASAAEHGAGAVGFETWREPNEGAFTIDVPRGWQVSGGIRNGLQPSEVNMNTSKQAYGISIAVAAFAASVSMGAHAEYRCKAPPTAQDVRACELVRVDRPNELRLFIQRTSSVYGLYFYDYVTQADTNRWDVARGGEQVPSIAAVDDGNKASVSRQ